MRRWCAAATEGFGGEASTDDDDCASRSAKSGFEPSQSMYARSAAADATPVAARTRTEDVGSATSLTAPAPAYAPGASRTTSAFNSAFAVGFARANSRPMCVSL